EESEPASTTVSSIETSTTTVSSVETGSTTVSSIETIQTGVFNFDFIIFIILIAGFSLRTRLRKLNQEKRKEN
ncbi:MAG: hypothetical protein ACFFBD_04410, partial [Candidatus Hodarchaeota archaeon]